MNSRTGHIEKMVTTHVTTGLHVSDQASEVARPGAIGSVEAWATDYRENAFDKG